MSVWKDAEHMYPLREKQGHNEMLLHIYQNVWQVWGEMVHSSPAVRNVKCCAIILEKNLAVKKLSVQLPEDPASSSVGIYPREMQANRDLNFWGSHYESDRNLHQTIASLKCHEVDTGIRISPEVYAVLTRSGKG